MLSDSAFYKVYDAVMTAYIDEDEGHLLELDDLLAMDEMEILKLEFHLERAFEPVVFEIPEDVNTFEELLDYVEEELDGSAE